MTQRAVRVAKEKGVGVVDLFMLKPFNVDKLFTELSRYRHVITMEEGFTNAGGLDAAIGALLAQRRSTITMDRIGFNDSYVFDLGSRDSLHGLNDMDDAAVIAAVDNARRG